MFSGVNRYRRRDLAWQPCPAANRHRVRGPRRISFVSTCTLQPFVTLDLLHHHHQRGYRRRGLPRICLRCEALTNDLDDCCPTLSPTSLPGCQRHHPNRAPLIRRPGGNGQRKRCLASSGIHRVHAVTNPRRRLAALRQPARTREDDISGILPHRRPVPSPRHLLLAFPCL